MASMKFVRPEKGFTLVEVLIALAIVSVALAAFVRMTMQSTINLGELEQRSLALLSAENSLSELQIGGLPAIGVHMTACPQADQRFVCSVQVGRIQLGLRPVVVDVYADKLSAVRLVRLESQLPEHPQ